MKWNKLVTVIVGLLVILTVVFYVYPPKWAYRVTGNKPSDKVVIGAILPLTGNSAAWGEQGRWGIEMAVEDINTQGGINGRRLEVIFEDSQAIPKNALAALNKLVLVDKVPAIIGDIVSATTLAIAPVVERNRVVLIAPTASAPAITNAGEYIFRVWPSDLLEGSVFARFLIGRGLKRLAILHIQNDYGQGLANAFKTTFVGAGGEVPSIQAYAQEETDFKPYLRRSEASRIQGIYLVSYYKDAALILKQAREIGLSTRFFGATAVESPKLIEIAGGAAEDLAYPIITDFDLENPTPRAAEFISKFKRKFGKDPDWASSHTYDAVLVAADAMRRGASSGEEIRRKIDSTRIFHGVTGTITFDENGDVIEKPVKIRVVRRGKFVPFE